MCVWSLCSGVSCTIDNLDHTVGMEGEGEKVASMKRKLKPLSGHTYGRGMLKDG